MRNPESQEATLGGAAVLAMQSPVAIAEDAWSEHDARQRTAPAHLLDAEDFGEDDSELDGEGRVRRVRWQVVEDQKIVEAVRPREAVAGDRRAAAGADWRRRAQPLAPPPGGAARASREEGAPPTALTEADLTAVLAGDGASGGRKMWSAEEDAIIQAGVASTAASGGSSSRSSPGAPTFVDAQPVEAAAEGGGGGGQRRRRPRRAAAAAPPAPRRRAGGPVPMAGGSTSSSSPPTAEGSDEVTPTRTPSPGTRRRTRRPAARRRWRARWGRRRRSAPRRSAGRVPAGVALARRSSGVFGMPARDRCARRPSGSCWPWWTPPTPARPRRVGMATPPMQSRAARWAAAGLPRRRAALARRQAAGW